MQSWHSPGRPGRDDQKNIALPLLATTNLEIKDWKGFLREMLERSSYIKTLRSVQSGGSRYAKTGWVSLRESGKTIYS